MTNDKTQGKDTFVAKRLSEALTRDSIEAIARKYAGAYFSGLLFQDADSFARFSDEMILAASPAEQPAATPIPMLLFCPQCGEQHIDGPEESEYDAGLSTLIDVCWTNPPHRSHLCHSCGCIWRPADVPTVGIASIETRGKDDNWTAEQGSMADADLAATDKHDTACRAAADERQAVSRKAGYILVPVEPTQAMLDRGYWPCTQGRGAKSVWGEMLRAIPAVPQPAQADARDEDAFVVKRLSEALADVYATLVGDDNAVADESLNAIKRVERAAQVLRLEVELYRAQAEAQKAAVADRWIDKLLERLTGDADVTISSDDASCYANAIRAALASRPDGLTRQSGACEEGACDPADPCAGCRCAYSQSHRANHAE